MDSRTLVGSEIDLGAKVVDALRQDDELDLQAALWWFDGASDEMRLLVATPRYKKVGPHPLYSRINRILDKKGLLDSLPLSRIWAVDSSHEIVHMLRRYMAAPSEHISFQNIYLDGLKVDYAYVYFIKKRKAGTRKKREP